MITIPDFTVLSFDYFNAFFQNAIQNSVILINEKGIITDISPAFTNCFGYTKDEIVGSFTSVLFTYEDQEKGLPEKELNHVMQYGWASDNNYIVNRNQTITWVSGESVLAKDNKGNVSILKVIQNIHEQKVSEASIIRLNDLNESILTSIEDAVIVINEDLIIIKANKAFSEFFSYSNVQDNLLSFKKFIKVQGVNSDLYSSIENTIATKNSFKRKQFEIELNSGEKRMFEVSCTPMQHKESDNNVLLAMHDITAYKQAEREREDIIGFVAHELRNPLANIVLCNEIMSESLNEKRIDDLESLLTRSKNNVMRLNKMIAELYDAARVNSGNMHLDISEFNFEEMLKEAVDTVGVLQPTYNLIIKGDANLPVRGDRYRLIQVVTNYLSNGIKYSDGNNDVVLTVQHNETTITVSVEDHGLGISKSQLPYIFERFFRAERTKNLEGIGLGLFLCRQIIVAHKGSVWAESEEGKGSIFYFSIPV